MSKEQYITVKKPSESLYIVKKSKFISNVLPIKDQKEAENHIASFRKKYWDATHNVYAYTLGLDDDTQKFSDDGEPSGTAGKPVLEVIKSKNIKNVLVVVTRYFGGIKLGAGGLVRAYSESAAIGLENSEIIKRAKCNLYKITTDYNMLGKIEWELNQKKLIIKDIEYLENVSITVSVPINKPLNFEDFILNITSGNATVKYLKSCYFDM